MAGADDQTERPDDARTVLMQEVAAQMDAIEADFGSDFEILSTITIVMLKRPDGNVGLRVRNSRMSPLEGIGLLNMAQDILKTQALQSSEDAE
jgi:hypothetical protein